MPALILPFYGNGTVVDYVKDKDDQTKLDMVSAFSSPNLNQFDEI
jgi:hypothetical protein